ncbi:hypothetical protein [Flavobacterium caseinilyticum]|uniref:DUF4270 family protein n=1 Tax=Flavobacterium caseinilyticum TaxID=2541732 RepID=A0A4R5AXH8_9FLAO|nr:hypothetical protein [Flavobacterium caseinilyticum]TDD77553.1 hypothetical protein E0F89_08205 [Flavobacterium caseinilyticum]
MKRFGIKKILGSALLLLIAFSCTSDLDYDQLENIKLEPVYVGNLAYFDVLANEFVTSGVEQNVKYDAPIFDLFNDAFFRKNFKKAELFFEVDNSITRAYTVDMVFLDGNKQAVHTASFFVPAYTGVVNKVTKTEVFENSQLDLLKRTINIAFTLTMLPGPALSESSPGNIKLRAGVTAYLVIE